MFERYQRSEKARYRRWSRCTCKACRRGRSQAITEELCGHSFSASTVSEATARLDEALKAFFERRLAEPYPYLILDARYERAREAGVIASQAVLVAIGVDWEGRRQVLGVELANRESHSSWREFVAGLKQRGLAGVEFVVSDDHPGLRVAIREVLPEAVWQRCYVHFLRNALDYVPRKVDDDCLMELRWFYDRRDLGEVRRDLAQWIAKWQAKYPKLVDWVENNIEETLSFYRLPLPHHKHMKSTNMLERLNQEIKRRTLVVRIFPNPQSCLRLVRALAVEIHENWLEATRYLNMDHLREHKKENLRALAA
nr:IS256 family transposase [Mesorhizobium ventifaucium]